MTTAELQHRILGALLQGPGEQFALAAAVAEAPFRVRAELKALKRQRLVREIVAADRHAWVLTAAGYAAARSPAIKTRAMNRGVEFLALLSASTAMTALIVLGILNLVGVSVKL